MSSVNNRDKNKLTFFPETPLYSSNSSSSDSIYKKFDEINIKNESETNKEIETKDENPRVTIVM
jgi:hypothetical protein